jgi:hypothetical protein
MSTIVTRAGKGSPLTHVEVDANFTNLNTDKVEKTAAAITGGTINGTTIGATTPSSVNATSVTTPTVTASATNLTLAAISTGAVNLNTAGGTGFRISDNGSMTSFWETFGGTGTNILSATGTPSNVGALYRTKGTSGHQFTTAGSNSNTQFNITHTASAVNYVQVTGAATGVAPVVSAQGSNTDIPLVLQPKGTGALQAQATDSGVAGGNVRGTQAVDWQTSRSSAGQVASGANSVLGGGSVNIVSANFGTISGGRSNTASGGGYSFVGGGFTNTASSLYSVATGGYLNTSAGYFNFIGGGFTNSATANAAVTTQATTAVTSGSTAVTLSATNANIKVGQYITGTGIASDTYVSAISTTSLTLSKNATATGTPTLSFFTPHGVVVGGGNNQATGSYSFIGGGGDAGTAANRNVASGDWSVVAGGRANTASQNGAFVGGGGISAGNSASGNTASGTSSVVTGGFGNTASNTGSSVLGGSFNSSTAAYATVLGGRYGTDRNIVGNLAYSASNNPIASAAGVSQGSILVLGVQTTDATATALRSDTSAAGTTNQVILPNNSAYFFRGEVVSGKTAAGDTKGWTIEGVIKRGANAASTALVGVPTVTSTYADLGAATWDIAVTADTTNGGLKVTFTGQAATTIRTVCQIRTTEMTF